MPFLEYCKVDSVKHKNTVTNTESDTQANIKTDHYPLIITIRAKLKKIVSHKLRRQKYRQCSD